MKINFEGQNFVHLCHFYFRSDLCMLSAKGGRDHLCFLSLGVFSEGTEQGRVWKDTEPGHMAQCGHGTLLFLEGCSDTQRPEGTEVRGHGRKKVEGSEMHPCRGGRDSLHVPLHSHGHRGFLM